MNNQKIALSAMTVQYIPTKLQSFFFFTSCLIL